MASLHVTVWLLINMAFRLQGSNLTEGPTVHCLLQFSIYWIWETAAEWAVGNSAALQFIDKKTVAETKAETI